MTAKPNMVFIVGGAGFLGSHFVDRLLSVDTTQRVTIYDNLSSGREWHFQPHLADPRFAVVRGDVKDLDLLRSSMTGHDLVIHLASNPDIAKAQTQPDVDFYEGSFLTQQVLEAMRRSGSGTILYASGSGVYGDLGQLAAAEDHAPMRPISTYGASKLAGEALIGAYCSMFGLRGTAFRFANVVGPRQTHGVGFDFIRRLRQEPSRLAILGDGNQSKSYIHVSDVIDAVFLAHEKRLQDFEVFNVATGDHITVTEIAEHAVECLGLTAAGVEFQYSGGDRGWKGDVPTVRLDTTRIRRLGWVCQHTSGQALRRAMLSMLADANKGLL